MLERLPSLRWVIRAGSGVDNLDLAVMEARGVRLLRNPHLSAQAVAELALGSLIMLTRRVPLAHALIAAGRWAKAELIGESIARIHAVIWGAGAVGRACHTALTPHCASVRFAAWRSVPPELPTVAPEEALHHADAHLLSLPLREDTRNWMGPRTLEQVRGRRPYLVNVGRFELMDLEAVLASLGRNELRGVFIDPIDSEHVPFLPSQLKRSPPMNLLFAQHLGAQRQDVLDAVGDWVLERLRGLMFLPE
jgi:D-3-phosphoglycerate dehydrogenase